jgi:hypothetical protein
MKLTKTKLTLLNELNNSIQGTSNQPDIQSIWNDSIEYDITDLERLKADLAGYDTDTSGIDRHVAAYRTKKFWREPLDIYLYCFRELRYNRKSNTIPIRDPNQGFTKDDRYDIWYRHFPQWDDVVDAETVFDKMKSIRYAVTGELA